MTLLKKLDKSTLIGVGQDFERIRRITGYLVGDMGLWNGDKRAEEKDLLKHPVNMEGKQ